MYYLYFFKKYNYICDIIKPTTMTAVINHKSVFWLQKREPGLNFNDFYNLIFIAK